MTLETIAEKVVPTLLLALIFAVLTLFQTVDRHNEKLKEMEKRQEEQLKYVIETRDIAKEIEVRYLSKETYYKNKTSKE